MGCYCWNSNCNRFDRFELCRDFTQFFRELRSWWKKKPTEEPLGADEMPPPKVSFWTLPIDRLTRPKKLPNSIPIVTVAAMKGGVGKTTLTANLAAVLDTKGKRVLLIDLDYQGSLSHTVTAAANMAVKASAVDSLIDGSGTSEQLLNSVRELGTSLPNTKVLTCYYQFSDTETNVMIDWICDMRNGKKVDDIRFRLEALLHDRTVQDEFDIILIDAPPRFSTGAINAFCASTHLIIPTVLDAMSAEAAVYFSQDIAATRQKLFPDLELVGVVPLT
jgi:chromosome partitioning protein